MIELLMFSSIAFLAGCLLMLPLVPLVHHRAVRLTTRNIIDATPFAMTEIRAQKDQLRAQFAMAIRRLEVNIESLKTKGTHYAAEIGRKQAEIHDLKVELQRNAALIGDLTAELGRTAALTNDLRIELDKKAAQLYALRARWQLHRSITRRIVKVLLFIFIRSDRRRNRGLPSAPQVASAVRLAHTTIHPVKVLSNSEQA